MYTLQSSGQTSWLDLGQKNAEVTVPNNQIYNVSGRGHHDGVDHVNHSISGGEIKGCNFGSLHSDHLW